MDEPVRHGGAGHVGDQLPAPLHRDMLEDDQVNGQGPQPGPIDRAESGTPAGRGATCVLPQAHLALCRSCCTRSAAAAGISSC